MEISCRVYRPRDPRKTPLYGLLELAQKACDMGEPMGCGLIDAAMASARRSAPGALAANKKACAAGDMRGCRDAATAYAQGEGVAVNKDEAQRLYDKACDGGLGEVCRDLGLSWIHIRVPKDKPRGARYLEKGCLAGDIRACQELGSIYMKGDGVPKDWVRGGQFLDRETELRKKAATP